MQERCETVGQEVSKHVKNISVSDLTKNGVSKSAVYKAMRAGQLTFQDGKADPVLLLAEWTAKHDNRWEGKIGPALERIIQGMGLVLPDEGKSRQQELTDDEPVLDADTAPAHLSPAMRDFWRRILKENGLRAFQGPILRVACEAYDRAEQARRLIAKDGLLLNNRRHPALDIETQSQGLFLRAMRQLGLETIEDLFFRP
jgi:phage terminase small subunit